MDEAQTDDHGRPEPPLEAGEAATLLGFLDYQRATLAWKCRGLSDEQLEPFPEPWASVDWDADPDWDWHSAAPDSGRELRALWAGRVERSQAVLDALLRQGEAAALGTAHPAWGGRARVSLRWVLLHMIEEYARHNGHADLIRESIDGETGE